MNKNIKNIDYMDVMGPSIYACFGRSFDCHHKMSGKIHLTTSIMGTMQTMQELINGVYNYFQEGHSRRYDLRFTRLNYKGESAYAKYVFIVNKEENMQDYILNLKEATKKKRESEMIQYEDLKLSGNIVDKTEEKRFVYGFKKDDVTVVFITLQELIVNLQFSDQNLSLFENIFGKFEDEKKDPEAIFNNSLFIFRDYHWWFIVLMFKIKNVNISGGTANRRHMINSVEIQLINYLNIFGFNTIYHPLDKFLNKGYTLKKKTRLFLSNKIPLNEIEKIKNFKGKLNKQNLTEILNMIKSENNSYKYDNNYYTFLIENILHCNKILLGLIDEWFYNKLEELSFPKIGENQMETDKRIKESLEIQNMHQTFLNKKINLSFNEFYDIFEYLNNLNKDKSALPKFKMFPFYIKKY